MTEPQNPPEFPSEPDNLQDLLKGAATADTTPPNGSRRPRYLPPLEAESKKAKPSFSLPLSFAMQDSYGQSEEVHNSLFALEGRMGRLSYQAGILVLVLAIFVVMFVCSLVFAFSSSSLMMMATGQGIGMGSMLFFILIILVFLGAMILLSVRRLHDINLSGLWILIPVAIGLSAAILGHAGLTFAPVISGLINGLFSLALAAIPGTAGDNRFGPIRYTSGSEKVMGWICLVFATLGTLLNLTHHHSNRVTTPSTTMAIEGLTAEQQARLDETMKRLTPEQQAKFSESMKRIQAMQEQIKADQAARNGQSSQSATPAPAPEPTSP